MESLLNTIMDRLTAIEQRLDPTPNQRNTHNPDPHSNHNRQKTVFVNSNKQWSTNQTQARHSTYSNAVQNGSHEHRQQPKQQTDNTQWSTHQAQARHSTHSNTVRNGSHEHRQQPKHQTDNTQFKATLKLIYRGTQLRHHGLNWDRLPEPIQTKINELFQFLTPPVSDDELTASLDTLKQSFQHDLRYTLKTHINKQLAINEDKLKQSKLNEIDRKAAHEISMRVLTRKYGRKTSTDNIDNWLAADLSVINRPLDNTTTSSTDIQPSTSDKPSNKRRFAEVIAIRTNNRYDPLSDHNDEHPTPTNGTIKKKPLLKTPEMYRQRSLSQPHPPSTKPTPTPIPLSQQSPTTHFVPPSTSAQPRPLPTPISNPALQQTSTTHSTTMPAKIPTNNEEARIEDQPAQSSSATHQPTHPDHNETDNMNDETIDNDHDALDEIMIADENDEDDEESTEQLPSSQGNTTLHNDPKNLTIHNKLQNKSDWDLVITGSPTILILGDSNLRLVRNIPETVQVHVYPGATLKNISHLLNNTKLPTSIQDVVIAVGINHRAWNYDVSVKPDLGKAHAAVVRQLKRAHFLGVSTSTQLPQRQQETIKSLNDDARQKFGGFRHYISPLRHDQVTILSTDRFLIHHDSATVNMIFDTIKAHFRLN